MAFDPNQPSELVSGGAATVAEEPKFDPSKPSELVKEGTGYAHGQPRGTVPVASTAVAEATQVSTAGEKTPTIDSDKLTSLFQGDEEFQKAVGKDASAKLEELGKTSVDPRVQRQRTASQIFLATRYQKPLSEIVQNYELYRGDYAQKAGWDPKMDDGQFFGQAGLQLKKEQTEGVMVGKMASSLAVKLYGGQDPKGSWDATQKEVEADSAYDPTHRDYYHAVADAVQKDYQAKVTKLGPAINAVTAYMGSIRPDQDLIANVAPEQRKAAMDAIAGLSQEDRDVVLALSSHKAKESRGAQPEEGEVGKLGRMGLRTFAEWVEGVQTGVRELQADLEHNTVEAFNQRASRPGSPVAPVPATDPEADYNRIQADHDLYRATMGLNEPAKGQGWVKKVSEWAAVGIPSILTWFSGPGLLMNFEAIKAENIERYRSKGIPLDKAINMASDTAGADVMSMMIGGKLIGKMTGMNKLIAGLKSAGARAAGETAIDAAAVGGVLSFQATSSDFIQALYRHFDAAIPEVDWHKTLDAYKESAPSTIAMMAVTALVAGGHAAFRDEGFARAWMKDKTAMRAYGVPEDVVKALQDAYSTERMQSILAEHQYNLMYATAFGKAPEQTMLGSLIGKVVNYRGWTGTLVRDDEGNFMVMPGVRKAGDPFWIEIEGTGKEPNRNIASLGVEPYVAGKKAGEKAQPPPIEQRAALASLDARGQPANIRDRIVNEAKARFMERRAQGETTANFDPRDIADGLIIGSDLILKGVTTLAEWSSRMQDEFGTGIRPFLGEMYSQAVDATKKDTALAATEYAKAQGALASGGQAETSDVPTRLADPTKPLTAREVLDWARDDRGHGDEDLVAAGNAIAARIRPDKLDVDLTAEERQMMQSALDKGADVAREKTEAVDVKATAPFSQLDSSGHRIVLAAYKTPDGKVFTGTDHMEAQIAAQDAGEKVDESMAGFVDGAGSFLNRPDTYQRAKTTQQINPAKDTYYPGDMHTGKLMRPLTSETATAESVSSQPVSGFTGDTNALEDALHKYENTGDISTVPDLVDHVEGLIIEGKAPESLQGAVDDYRDAAEENFKEYGGRGDADQYEDAFVDAVRKAAKQMSLPQAAGAASTPLRSAYEQAGGIPEGNEGPVRPPAGGPGAAAQAAIDRMNKRHLGRVAAGLDPADILDATIVVADMMIRGGKSFAAAVAQFESETGESMRPILGQLYAGAQELQRQADPQAEDMKVTKDDHGFVLQNPAGEASAKTNTPEMAAKLRQDQQAATDDPNDALLRATKGLPDGKETSVEKQALEEAKNLGAASPMMSQAADVGRGIWDSLSRAANYVRNVPMDGGFRQIVSDWVGGIQIDQLKFMPVGREVKRVAPDRLTRIGMSNWRDAGYDEATIRARLKQTTDTTLRKGYQAALKLTDEQKAMTEVIGKWFDDQFKRAVKEGVMDEKRFREDYITQIIDRPYVGGGVASAYYGKLDKNFKYSQARTFPNFGELEQAGFKAATKDILEIMTVYNNALSKAVNTRRMLSRMMIERGSNGDRLAYHGKPPEDVETTYEEVKHPSLRGMVFHPEVAGWLRNILGRSAIQDWYDAPGSDLVQISKRAAKFVDQSNRFVANTMLGAFSMFHPVHLAKRGFTYGINVFNLDKIDPADPEVQEAVKNGGLMLISPQASRSEFTEGTGGHRSGIDILGKVPYLRRVADANQAMQHMAFEVFLPRLKFTAYKALRERNMRLFSEELKAGKITPRQISALTGEQVNARFGHQNYALLNRNPTIQHFIRFAALAPDFLEATIRNYGQQVVGLTGAKAGRQPLYGLAVTAGSLMLVSRAVNMAINDDKDPHWEEPFMVYHNGRYYGIRNEAQDLLNFWEGLNQTFHRGGVNPYLVSRLSPMVSHGLNMTVGMNWRGERITPTDALRDAAVSWVPISMKWMPGVSEALKDISPTQRYMDVSNFQQFLLSQGIQIRRGSPIADAYKLAHEWNQNLPKDDPFKAKDDTGTYPVSEFQPIRYALEDNDDEKAYAAIKDHFSSVQKEIAGKAKADAEQRGLELKDDGEIKSKTLDRMQLSARESLLHTWTKSEESDAAFLQSLEPKEAGEPMPKALHQVLTAQFLREAMYGRFQQLLWRYAKENGIDWEPREYTPVEARDPYAKMRDINTSFRK
jgi:hypothetical protein